MKKVLLVANTSWYLYNFRKPLAEELRRRGWDPVFVAPKDQYSEKIQSLGFRFVEWKLKRKSMNPLNEFIAFLRLFKIYLLERPEHSHHFTIKCVIYGSLISKLMRIPRINAVTGIGHVFLSDRILVKLIRPLIYFLYRFVLKSNKTKVVFQNLDDQAFFEIKNLVNLENCYLIKSSGVDVARFQPASQDQELDQVIFVGRLLKEKGIIEYCEAAKILKDQGLQTRFIAAGGIDEGNPSSLTLSDLKDLSQQTGVEFLGQVEKIESLIAVSKIVVLPSYREGGPRVILEASAMAKAVIVTDVPGCRDVIIPNQTGLLVPVRESKPLASAIKELLLDKPKRIQFGKAGRNFIETHFSDTLIAKQTADLYFL